MSLQVVRGSGGGNTLTSSSSTTKTSLFCQRLPRCRTDPEILTSGMYTALFLVPAKDLHELKTELDQSFTYLESASSLPGRTNSESRPGKRITGNLNSAVEKL